ncbi:uncharacterized protein LOC126593983 [Malus sylvestris]|uniref:uncharacterized protein LOC126593983 n=1 Tax=Malus sylvestris TaxID=3752 RepID=UPI0021ACC637|nr:uncharacterized protein LOC126593983 [Malus sylvestris]XP_050116143.1 uncharacterized protein LOC126593983 [Malus sylvestris]
MGIVSLCRLLEEVCEGSIGEGGLRFKVQKIQGMHLYAFPIFQKLCSWRRFETDLKLVYRDFIQFGGFGNLYQFGFDWNFWAHLIQRFQSSFLLSFSPTMVADPQGIKVFRFDGVCFCAQAKSPPPPNKPMSWNFNYCA